VAGRWIDRDRIPYSYYEHKLAAERAVEGAGVPSTVVRATQFHEFVAESLGSVARVPVWPLPTKWTGPGPRRAGSPNAGGDRERLQGVSGTATADRSSADPGEGRTCAPCGRGHLPRPNRRDGALGTTPRRGIRRLEEPKTAGRLTVLTRIIAISYRRPVAKRGARETGGPVVAVVPKSVAVIRTSRTVRGAGRRYCRFRCWYRVPSTRLDSSPLAFAVSTRSTRRSGRRPWSSKSPCSPCRL
jgi:hypothetical protein